MDVAIDVADRSSFAGKSVNVFLQKLLIAVRLFTADLANFSDISVCVCPASGLVNSPIDIFNQMKRSHTHLGRRPKGFCTWQALGEAQAVASVLVSSAPELELCVEWGIAQSPLRPNTKEFVLCCSKNDHG